VVQGGERATRSEDGHAQRDGSVSETRVKLNRLQHQAPDLGRLRQL
jgi:hypothetical protein